MRSFSAQRRLILKGMAALVLDCGLGSGEAQAAGKSGKMATLIDVDACNGCGACVRACRAEHLQQVPTPLSFLPDEPVGNGRHIRQDWSKQRDVTDCLTPYNWLYIQSCVVNAGQGVERRVFVPRRCMHCLNPTCVSFCPTGALRQRSSGGVYIAHASCLGERACMFSCPWSIPRYQRGVGIAGNGLIFKCDLCGDRLGEGGIPPCVAACRTGAQVVDSYDKIVERAAVLADARKGDIFGFAENGGTTTLYISALPFRDLDAALLRQNQVGPGRPSLRRADDRLERANRLLRNVLLAPLVGVGLASLRLWRDKKKRQPL